ncbi:MAG TPA: hypothetical protein DDW65_13845 [Firmicutes bacterium]|jgi:hypothetical protein|nr:hypothetical protein [Bacillota bacterium]
MEQEQQFQSLILEALERITQENTEVRQLSGQLNQRIDNIESVILRIENDVNDKLRALLETAQVQIEINQRILDALTKNEAKDETPSKGLFS